MRTILITNEPFIPGSVHDSGDVGAVCHPDRGRCLRGGQRREDRRQAGAAEPGRVVPDSLSM